MAEKPQGMGEGLDAEDGEGRAGATHHVPATEKQPRRCPTLATEDAPLPGTPHLQGRRLEPAPSPSKLLTEPPSSGTAVLPLIAPAADGTAGHGVQPRGQGCHAGRWPPPPRRLVRGAKQDLAEQPGAEPFCTISNKDYTIRILQAITWAAKHKAEEKAEISQPAKICASHPGRGAGRGSPVPGHAPLPRDALWVALPRAAASHRAFAPSRSPARHPSRQQHREQRDRSVKPCCRSGDGNLHPRGGDASCPSPPPPGIPQDLVKDTGMQSPTGPAGKRNFLGTHHLLGINL